MFKGIIGGISSLLSGKVTSSQNHNINQNFNQNICVDDLMQNIDINKSSVAVIYARVSTKNQVYGDSLHLQLQECKKYCEENNLLVVKKVQEICSARDMNKLKNLLEIINNYKDVNLVIFEPTRFSRNPKDYHNILPYLIEKNIVLHFVQGKLVSDNNNHKKIISSLIIDGQIESENLSRRIKTSIKFRKLNDVFCPSVSRYGYSYCKISKKQNINPTENLVCELIKKLYYGGSAESINKLLILITGNPEHKIYDYKNESVKVLQVQYGNLSINDVKEFLNYAQIYKRGKPWTNYSVKRILGN